MPLATLEQPRFVPWQRNQTKVVKAGGTIRFFTGADVVMTDIPHDCICTLGGQQRKMVTVMVERGRNGFDKCLNSVRVVSGVGFAVTVRDGSKL